MAQQRWRAATAALLALALCAALAALRATLRWTDAQGRTWSHLAVTLGAEEEEGRFGSMAHVGAGGSLIGVDITVRASDAPGVRLRRREEAGQRQLERLRERTEELAREALGALAAGESEAPAFCTAHASMRATRGQALLLASAPGSGNTWVRSIIRAGTRVYTGSVYRDAGLYERGFRGEMISPSKRRAYVVKTHLPFLAGDRKAFPVSWAQGAIHVVRAPPDAALADCKRRYTGLHTADLRAKRIHNLCPRYAKAHVASWMRMMRFWQPDDAAFRGFNGTFMLDMLPPNKYARKGFPVATFFYEDLSRDAERTYTYLFAFLKAAFPTEPLPSVRDSVACALAGARSLEKLRRKPAAAAPPPLFRNASGTTRLGRRLCAAAEGYWNEAKWGPCDGRLQRERDGQTGREAEEEQEL